MNDSTPEQRAWRVYLRSLGPFSRRGVRMEDYNVVSYRDGFVITRKNMKGGVSKMVVGNRVGVCHYHYLEGLSAEESEALSYARITGQK